MRKALLILSVWMTGSAHAQKTPDPRPFAAAITAADLKKHLYIVAGEEFEGRETTTEGQRKAAAYIEDYFRSAGLLPGNKEKDSYQLYYPVFRDSLTGSSIRVNDQSFRLDEDFMVILSANHTEHLWSNTVVFAGYGISDSLRDDYRGLDVSGKLVLVLDGIPPDRQLSTYASPEEKIKQGALLNKTVAAGQHGARGVLIIQQKLTVRSPRNSGMYLDGYKDNIQPNAFYVSEKIAEAIMGTDYAAAKAGDPKTGSYSVNAELEFSKVTTLLQSSDVLGFLEGTDLKDQLVVLSAHYDHLGKRGAVIYYGADDDGSGTVSILELAKAFVRAKAAGKGPRRSILFLANSGEEEGLWGSRYYSDHPVYPLDHTTVDLNIDMIGRIDPNRKHGDSANYVYVVGDDKLSTDLKPISESQNKNHTKLELDYKYNDPTDPEKIYYRSDHYSFARKGVPIIFYFDGIHKDYHRPTDTPDKVNYDILEKRARLVFFTAWEMANRNEMLKRDIP